MISLKKYFMVINHIVYKLRFNQIINYVKNLFYKNSFSNITVDSNCGWPNTPYVTITCK